MPKKIPHSAIVLSIAEDNVARALGVARPLQGLADIIEIRLDTLAEPALEPFVQGLTTPLLFTNRPAWEGGQWQGAEEARLDLLCQAANAGAALVDLELRAPDQSWQRLLAESGPSCAVVASWHDFSSTPTAPELEAILLEMKGRGADLAKIVTTAHDYRDVLRVLGLQMVAAQENMPLAAFAMGEAGRISRAATLELGGALTYAAADQASATAPGQLTVAQIRQIQGILQGGDDD
ncbi:MAG: type I 3-dehydroquinate dehydratase [Thermodesulfobacteriota bacterium]